MDWPGGLRCDPVRPMPAPPGACAGGRERHDSRRHARRIVRGVPTAQGMSAESSALRMSPPLDRVMIVMKERIQTFACVPIEWKHLVLNLGPLGGLFAVLVGIPLLVWVAGGDRVHIIGLRTTRAGVALVCVPIVGWTRWSARTARVVVARDRLRIASDLWGCRLSCESLRLAEARIVDLEREPSLRPIAGLGAKAIFVGDASGVFRLGPNAEAFASTMDSPRVVHLPTTSGRGLLASVADPEGFVAAVARAAEDRLHRVGA